jgi:hypothetical protein
VIDAIKLIRPGDGDPRADFTYCVVKPKTGDKRSARRRRTRLRSGKLLDPRNALLIDCQIYDRSEKGARIRLIGECPVPRSIRLYEESPERLLEANVVWRKDREIGLCFTPNAQPRSISKAQLAHLRGHFTGPETKPASQISSLAQELLLLYVRHTAASRAWPFLPRRQQILT